MKLLQNNSKSEMGGWRVERPLFHPKWKFWNIQVNYFENHGSTVFQPNSSQTGGLVAELHINYDLEGGLMFQSWEFKLFSNYLTVWTAHCFDQNCKVFHYLTTKFFVGLQDMQVFFNITEEDECKRG